jgi:CBS domain-containing protein
LFPGSIHLRVPFHRASSQSVGAENSVAGDHEMQVRELMTPNPETISPATTIRESAEKMLALDVGMMPVCEGENMVGVVTDRDITTRAVAKGLDPNSTHVRDIMSPDLVCCYEDDDIHDCIKLMEGSQVRRVPVLDRADRLVGVISLGDLAVRQRDNEEMKKLTEEALEQISEPVR